MADKSVLADFTYDGHLGPIMPFYGKDGEKFMAMMGGGFEVSNIQCPCGMQETVIVIRPPAHLPMAAAYFVALNRAQLEKTIEGMKYALDILPAPKAGL